MSCDPAGLVDGTNRYRYALNSPIKMRDPSGTTAGLGPGLGPDYDEAEQKRTDQDRLVNQETVEKQDWAEYRRSLILAGNYDVNVEDSPDLQALKERRIEAEHEAIQDSARGETWGTGGTGATLSQIALNAHKGVEPTIGDALALGKTVTSDPKLSAGPASRSVSPSSVKATSPVKGTAVAPAPAKPAAPPSKPAAPTRVVTSAPTSTVKKIPNPEGAKGSPTTQAQNARIADELHEKEGYTISGGGGREKETYFPGPGGKNRGSVRIDVTATKPDDTVHVQTVDTRGKQSSIPDKRELRNAGKILKADRNAGLFLIPKKKN